jgi:5-methylcytosine-specific restriction enzyme subunit McrC
VKIAVPVNHNYQEKSPILESWLCKKFEVKNTNANRLQLQRLFSSVYEMKIGSEQLKQTKIFSFKKNKFFEPDEDRLILKLYSKERPGSEKEYYLQTGLYAGTLFYKGCKINITSRYGDSFLRRMLNFVNEVYIDTEQVSARKEENDNQFLYIIAYLFIQTLEKAVVLGLPHEYKKQKERSHKVRGSIDFNAYLKRDIPFQGKLTSIFNERCYVQEIVDVIYLALKKLEQLFGHEIHNKLLGVSQVLKQYYSGRYANVEIIRKAKTHQSLNNPLYNNFKKVLEYAEIILLDKDLMPDENNSKQATTGYLFDIAELFELYIEKLLSKNIIDWSVNAQEAADMYQNNFYSRSMFPDIVMRHKQSNKIAVFDAKFKRMRMSNKDIDRSDLHQIHSYVGYYYNDIIVGGLLYPLSNVIDTNKAHSNSLYGVDNNNIKFIVDGIYVDENQTMKDLIQTEGEFIARIASVLDC